MRVGYNPMAIIPRPEMLCIDLEFPYTAGHVEEIGTADFQGKRQLDCYAQYSLVIIAKQSYGSVGCLSPLRRDAGKA